MRDPQPPPAGSPETGPAASNPAANPSFTGAEYQFPTRKARRVAELTGMIPIIVPGTPSPAKSAQRPAKGASEPAVPKADALGPDALDSDALDDDGARHPVAHVADTGEEVRPDIAEATAQPMGEAPDEPAADSESGDSEAEQPTTAAGDAAAQAKLRAPVAAADVTGIPVVPAPAGPVGVLPEAATAAKAPRTPKAGRDLPAAITVGVTLLLLVVGSLVFFPLAFVVLATAFVTVGVWEVTRAIATKGIKAPLTPVMIGALAMPASAYFAGSEGLLFALVASCGATLLWRSLDPEQGALKSIMAGIFSLMWIPFLLSFVFLLLRGERSPTLGFTLDMADINPGVVQVIIMLLLVVANDTFGYLVGVLFGKHAIAPKISPKKSWEGFAGSLGGAALVAIPATVFLLDEHWWVGFALAIGMVFAGTGGDFAESMIKRELGVKDMSNLLPGHGGVMDRLDSILFAAPVAYATFSVLGQI